MCQIIFLTLFFQYFKFHHFDNILYILIHKFCSKAQVSLVPLICTSYRQHYCEEIESTCLKEKKMKVLPFTVNMISLIWHPRRVLTFDQFTPIPNDIPFVRTVVQMYTIILLQAVACGAAHNNAHMRCERVPTRIDAPTNHRFPVCD